VALFGLTHDGIPGFYGFYRVLRVLQVLVLQVPDRRNCHVDLPPALNILRLAFAERQSVKTRLNRLNQLHDPHSRRSVGIRRAGTQRMAKNYRELIIWQLGFRLRLQVVAMTKKCPRTTDRDFLWDIRRSARSVPSKIAEGHGRFHPKDNHHFLEIAKASLDETENHLDAGLADGDFIKDDYDVAKRLIKRITPAMTRLMAYLRTEEAKRNAARIAATNYWPQRTKKNL
jgi:four helix bundle protein